VAPPMSRLDRALQIAAVEHEGQADKAGEPYILHVMRVVLAMPPHSDAQIVAALHDVIEDSGMTLAEIEEAGFGHTVVRAMDAITRREGETYEAYIQRVADDGVATAVKLADLRDNLGRATDAVDPHGSLRKRYAKALDSLGLLPRRASSLSGGPET
jgi:(p)ppGpp synthase/HD superfamily hydrolase